MEWLQSIPVLALAAVVFVVVAIESLGLPLPGETILVAGVLAALAGHHEPWVVAAAAAAGAILGDNIGYLIGRRFGARVFDLGRARLPRLFNAERIDRASAFMQRHGIWAVFVARFVAILRIFSGPLAGSLGMPFARFFAANAAGAIVWAGAVTGVVLAFGELAERAIHAFSWGALVVVLLALLVIGVVVGHAAGLGWARAVGRIAARVWRLVRRVPVTTAFLLLYLAIGVATASLWVPLHSRSWLGEVAYGIPSFKEGRWWTVITGTFLSMEPVHYALMVAAIVIALGWLEWKRGPVYALVAYWAGQIVAILGSAAIVDALARFDWNWPRHLETVLDVGPSGGLAVCLALAIATLRSPWRFRLRLAFGAALIVPLLFIGALADLEHFVGGMAVLLFGFGYARSRPSVREWRLVAFVGVVLIGIVQIVAIVVPTSGPFGDTTPGEIIWWDVAVDVVIILLVARGLMRGRFIAWVATLVVVVFNVAEAVVALTLVDDWAEDVAGIEIGLAASTLWLLLGVLIVIGRRAFRVPLRRSRRSVSVDGSAAHERTLQFLHRYGGGTLSWMITWPLMRVAFGDRGDWALGVRRVRDVAIALGDPVVAPGGEREAVREFVDRCERLDVVPCFFSAAESTRAALPEDWRSLEVADDSIVDLPGLEFTGKAWQPSRGSINRAERDGISFRLTRLADEPWSIRAQVRAISEEWVGDKGLPEMGFTLGGVDEALDPAVRVALALDADGAVHGVLSWLPVYGPEAPGGESVVRGWTLDVMRRRDGAFPPVIEFLISSSLLAFRDEGAQYASLSGAPLAQAPGEDDGPIQRLLSTLGGMLEPLYGFRSLHAFKRKFNPREEPLYLLYRDEADLPAIGLALTKAFLPTASALDLARAGAALTHH